MDRDDYKRLEEIQTELLELLDEAKTILRQNTDRQTFDRVKAYWLGNCESWLGDPGYMNTHQYTMASTLKEVNPLEYCAGCEEELTEDNSDSESDYCWECEDDNDKATEDDYLGEENEDKPETD